MKQPISHFLASFVKRHLFLLFSLCLLIILVALCDLLPSFVLRYIIDQDLSVTSSSISTDKIILDALWMFASYLFIALFSGIQNILLDSFGQKMIHSLRIQMMRKASRMKYSYHVNHGKGELTSKVMDDVNAIETLFASGLISLFVSIFKVLGILISIFIFSWSLGLFLLALIPLIYLITRIFQKKMQKNHAKNQQALNKLNNRVSESLNNIDVILSHKKETYEENNFDSLLEESYHLRMKTAFFDSVYSPCIQMLKAFTIGVITILVSYGLQTSEIAFLGITVGTFAASINLVSNLFSPIETIGMEMESMQEGISGMKRVNQFLNEEEEVQKENIEKKDLKENVPLIEIKNLSYHYDDSIELIFNDTSLIIQKGSQVAFQGRTGAGKTTLFRLLTGLVEPSSGSIKICGIEAKKIPSSLKSELFGYVSQGFQKVPGTIKDQITLKDPSITQEQVEKAMKQVFLDDYVKNEIKGGYDQKFEENLFSRGQLQLLSFARAIVKDPEILLLDEISANLDTDSEKKLLLAIQNLKDKKTVLCISHRLNEALSFSNVISVENQKLNPQK